MKLTVEFELDDSWEAYLNTDQDRLDSLLRHDISGVKTTIIKRLELKQDLEFNNVVYLTGEIKTEKEWCDIIGALALVPLSESDMKYFRLN